MKKLFATISLLLAGTASLSAINVSGPNPLWPVGQGDVAVRYKDFSNLDTGKNHYVGVDDLGVGANRTDQEVNWLDAAFNSFSFTYNAATGLISSVVNGGTANTYNTVAGLNINFLELILVDNGDTPDAYISDLMINGEAVANLGQGTVDRDYWTVSGFSSGNLTVTGNIYLGDGYDGDLQGKNEASKFEIRGHHNPVPDSGATAMLLGLGVLGLIGARKRFAK